MARPEQAPPRSAWRALAGALGWRAAPPAADGLPAARAALIACLSDLNPIDTLALRQLLGHAGSMAELWHLRPMVYRHLALALSQADAERRLAPLNPLFASLPSARS